MRQPHAGELQNGPIHLKATGGIIPVAACVHTQLLPQQLKKVAVKLWLKRAGGMGIGDGLYPPNLMCERILNLQHSNSLL